MLGDDGLGIVVRAQPEAGTRRPQTLVGEVRVYASAELEKLRQAIRRFGIARAALIAVRDRSGDPFERALAVEQLAKLRPAAFLIKKVAQHVEDFRGWIGPDAVAQVEMGSPILIPIALAAGALATLAYISAQAFGALQRVRFFRELKAKGYSDEQAGTVLINTLGQAGGPAGKSLMLIVALALAAFIGIRLLPRKNK